MWARARIVHLVRNTMKRSWKGLITSTIVITTLIGCGGDGGSARNQRGVGGSTAGQTSTMGGSQQAGGTTSPVGGASTNGGASASGGGSLTAGAGGKVSQPGGAAGQTTIATGGAGGSAGANNGGSSNQAGGTTNQAGQASCIAPACCVPATLNRSRVDVYQVSGSIIVNLVVEPSDPARISSVWMPFAEITTSWGGTQICDTDRRRGKGAYFVTLRCPATAPSTPLDCGSPASVKVRLRTETYAETTPFGPVCMGGYDGPATTFAVPVKCPTCPSSATFFGNQVCDYPDLPSGTSITQCSYFQPCPCMVNESTGVKLWMCPQP